jgi:hypothetical protein
VQKAPIWKRILAAVLGLPALLLGLGSLLLTLTAALSAGLHTTRNVVTFILSVAFSFVYVFLGTVGLSFGSFGVGKSKPGVTWWKIFLGALLIAIELKNQIAPAPNLLKADNDAQQIGMWIGAILVYCVGLWLIVAGVRARYLPIPQPVETPSLP